MIRNAFAALLFIVTISAFPQYRIEGLVTDEKDAPLEGANVLIKENNLGTVSDAAGKFSIEIPHSATYTIQVSFLGYETYVKSILVDQDLKLTCTLKPTTFWGEEIIVSSTRAGENTPATYTTVEKAEIEKQNLGQDLPFLLGLEPSLVYSSDAGTGVGYTSLWIRGSNIQRINVTVNGVPLNDPESHVVYWVDLPDFSSSVQSAQIQRGVGTSTNGGGAFGANLNLETNYINREAYGQISSSMGSFNTWKNTFQLGTGLIKEKWAFEGRASSITTDGYVDRAFSNLKSFFLQGGYFGHSTLLKAVVFGGKEKTYQAWYGVDRETMENDPTFNWAGAIYDKEWNIAAFYDNETDNYQQDHYQLHLSQIINSSWRFNCSLHYTYGRGYYEQYYSNEYLGDYPIGVQYFGYDSLATGDGYNYFYHDTISTGDLIVRRWLDNHFYGTTFALYYDAPGLKFTFGGAYNQYANAKHFGEIIWAEYAGDTQLGDKFYDNTSDKTDANFYSKIGYPMFNMLNFYIDLQTRYINYKGKGIDKGNQIISIDEAYWFFNPKAGLSLHVGSFGTIYSSYAIAHREPIRTDFLDAPEGIVPKPERLQDIEAGIRKQGKTYSYSMNGYFMLYTNQLVLTGEINDVGEPIRKNIGKSHRLGIEAEGAVTMTRFFKLRANIAYSLNRTDFRQVEDGEIVEYSNTPLTFSPPLISGFELVFIPFGTFEITFTGKYVDRQYLDLTGNKYKSLDPYFINNLRIAWLIREESLGECGLSFQINNLSNRHYASNGYVWDNVPYFYPQAGIQLIGGVNLRF